MTVGIEWWREKGRLLSLTTVPGKPTTPLQPPSSSCLHSPHICSALPPQMTSLIFIFRDGSIQEFVNTVDNVLLLPSSVPSRLSACVWDVFKVKLLEVGHSSPPSLLPFPGIQFPNHFALPTQMYSPIPPPLKSLSSQVQLTYQFLCLHKVCPLEIKGSSQLWFILIYPTTQFELNNIAIGLEGTLRAHVVHLCPKRWSAVQTSITPDRHVFNLLF